MSLMYLIGRNMFTSDNIKLSEVIFIWFNAIQCYALPRSTNTGIIRHSFHLKFNVIQCFQPAQNDNFFGIFFGIILYK